MWSYLIRRILSVIPVLLVVATIVFLMLRLTPGDPAANIAGDAATTEDIAKLRVDLGLEEPLPVQFAIYIKNIVKGDCNELSGHGTRNQSHHEPGRGEISFLYDW